MSSKPSGKSGRDVVAYFAGYLANIFNGNDVLGDSVEVAAIKPFALYDRVRKALIGNHNYADVLVGVWAYPPPTGPDDAADFYFDSVLDRPIAARRGEPTSADNLAQMVLARAVGPRPVAAAGTNLSTWKALISVGGLKRFKETRELYEFSNRILKCLDAANRPYAEVLRLGLCPKEWLVGDEAVGVNTLKAANAFLKALKAQMHEQFGRRPTKAELEAAYALAPVPGSKDAHAFAITLLGSAILARLAGLDHIRIGSYDAMEGTVSEPVREAADEPLMTSGESAPFLDNAVAAGALATAERSLLTAIIEGSSLEEALAANPFLRRRLKQDFEGNLEAYIEDLSARTAKFVRNAAEGRP